MAYTHIWRALAALIFSFVVASIAWAQPLQPVPTLSARVIDQSHTLSAEETAQIEARLHEIEEKSGSQVVVLMIPSTAPEDIAAYAHRIASTWKIGRKDIGDGLLIVVAKDDRRMRIEVARALEGAIPDIAASHIIDQQMAPFFRQGDYAKGILSAIDQIGARIADEDLPQPSAPAAPSISANHTSSSGPALEGWGMFLFIGIMVLAPMIRRLLGKTLGPLLVGAGVGVLVFFLTYSLWIALAAGVVAVVLTFITHNSGGGGGSSGGRGGGGFSRGSHSSRHSGGGGFRSGGGGSFGGGGASGRW